MPSKYCGDKLRKIIKSIRDGSFEYENRETKKTNWIQYDYAQIKEIANYLENLRCLVDEANMRIRERTFPKKRGPGRPPIDSPHIAKILLLQTYTASPNRIAEGLLLLFREKLGISEHFSYKTIERGYDREAVNEILDEIVVITNESVEGIETTFSFDGTGFSASNKENYAAKRQMQSSQKKNKNSEDERCEQKNDSFPESNSKMGFSYAVMGVGVQHKLISGMAVSPDHSKGETTMFPEAYNQTLDYHPNLEKVLGDGIYGVRKITDLVSEDNATPYFLPRSNVTFKSKGYSGWYEMLFSLCNDTQNWLEEYHMRSISETVNSMVKCRFGNILRKKLDSRKKTETTLRLVAHDIRRVGYLLVMGEIEPFWYLKGA